MLTSQQIKRVQEIAKIRGWQVTYWFNHGTWQASYKDKTMFRGDNVVSYEEAWEKFIEALVDAADPINELILALILDMI